MIKGLRARWLSGPYAQVLVVTPDSEVFRVPIHFFCDNTSIARSIWRLENCRFRSLQAYVHSATSSTVLACSLITIQ